MRKYFASSVLVLALASSAFGADTVIEEIIARINSSIITRSDFEKAKEQAAQEAKEKGQTDEAPKREQDTLRDLIDQQLLVQKAADLGITGDTEVIKRLDEIRKSMNLATMEDLEKAAEAQGVSYEDFKQNLKNNIVTQAVIGREVGSHIQITKEESQQFYEEHKKELEHPEQVELSEILIAPVKADPNSKEAPPEPTPDQLAAAEKKANEILVQIKAGAKFDDMAKKYSDGPTASQGGDLGAFRRGMLSKDLEDKTFAMKKGDVTDVIRTRQGFVILRVNEHTSAGVPPFADVKDQVDQAIYLKKLQPALRAYLTKLREEAYIDIKPGYEDTGASPNQTQPVYMAADSPQNNKDAVEKKKKKKFLLF